MQLMKLHVIDCGNFKVDGGALFGVIPKTMWQKKYKCDVHNLCNIKMRSLLVETADRLVLIDTGAGTKQDATFFKYYYLNGEGELMASLAQKGFKPTDITDVLHTHLHFDHCGGTLMRQGDSIVSAFPNANLWVSKEQWEWAVTPNKREAPAYPSENILPMANTGRLKLITDEGELFPGIFTLMAHGHTKGQIIPVIDINGTKLVYCADLIPTTANVPLSFISAYDLFQIEVLDEKEQLLNTAIENNMTLFFEHDIEVECCSLIKNTKGVMVDQVFSLEYFMAQVAR